jgi:hypothetical protein
MGIKEDILQAKQEVKEIKEEHSLAYEIILEYKKSGKALKILLGISILVNVLIAIILK